MNVGNTFNQSFSVTAEIYSGFIRLFKDENPLHTNEMFAKEKGFASVVMHGNILNGFISFFIGECLPMKNVIIHTQEIKFNNPCYLGDQLLFEAMITDMVSAVSVVVFKFQFKNQDGLKIANGKIQIGIIK
ncbi:MAG: hypothetical protein EOP48_15675 [Sphingobacteriales bacterium]|nr:MAG: hypothetical protein EOP48_15675 [Sphingobacteriales bacterium]